MWERQYLRPGHPDHERWFPCDESGTVKGFLGAAIFEEARHADPNRMGPIRRRAPETNNEVYQQRAAGAARLAAVEQENERFARQVRERQHLWARIDETVSPPYEPETIELPDGRPAPVELVGRVVDFDHGMLVVGVDDVPRRPIAVGDELMLRPMRDRDSRWRPGSHRVVGFEPGGITARILLRDRWAVTAQATDDYVYRIGRPLTPSLDERVTAIERLLGIVVDDLEVAMDAALDGRRDEAIRLRSAALERIREQVAHPVVTVRGDSAVSLGRVNLSSLNKHKPNGRA